MAKQHFDVIIIGAGLSGIGSACHIVQQCPEKSLAILERRERMGGTWDLFRYPGIRSDSDMASFGFDFKPWYSNRVLAQGPDIREYVVETAKDYGIQDKVHTGIDITEANWSSTQQLWELTGRHTETGEQVEYTCQFLNNCSGYYNYDQGYRPTFKDEDRFKGQIIHPQHWPENLDYADKEVVIIGSGATAVTLVPAMADKTKHITMLQRSPTYFMPLPDVDHVSNFLNKFLPRSWVFKFARKRNIFLQRSMFKLSMRWPALARKFFTGLVKKELGKDFDMSHFTPKYNPWEQRLCVAPDGDLFESIRSGKASVVTDEIDCFTENGIQLKSGQHLNADIIVTATGLNIQLLGGMKMKVNDKDIQFSDRMVYKSSMIQGIPNFIWVFGYTNAPWTLKCDITARYLCRLIKHMDAQQKAVATPIDQHDQMLAEGILDEFSSGYVQRATHLMPKQGKQAPWRIDMHYENDKRVLLKAPLEDGILVFEPRAQHHSNPQATTDKAVKAG